MNNKNELKNGLYEFINSRIKNEFLFVTISFDESCLVNKYRYTAVSFVNKECKKFLHYLNGLTIILWKW